jgi:hypothetical protein
VVWRNCRVSRAFLRFSTHSIVCEVAIACCSALFQILSLFAISENASLLIVLAQSLGSRLTDWISQRHIALDDVVHIARRQAS